MAKNDIVIRSDILELAANELKPYFESRRDKIYATEQSMLQDLFQQLNLLLSNVHENQVTYKSKAINSLVFSTLQSSFVSGTYDYKISVFDDDIWVMKNPPTVYWRPGIFDFYIEDIEHFTKLAKRKLARVKDWELEEFSYKYIELYDNIINSFVHKNVVEILKLPILSKADKQPDFKILMGRHMDYLIVLAQSMEEVS